MSTYKRTILVVDDNEMNRDILSDLLSDEYQILEAENGKVALDLLKNREIAVSAILLDVQMPVMDGFAVLSAVREDQVLSQIPIIVTTASNDIQTETKCLSYGAADFVGKPFHPEAVKARLKNAIHLRESVATLSAVEFDDLTGIYTKAAFLRRAETLLKQNPSVRYDMLAADVSSFKYLNDTYGEDKAAELLRFVGRGIRSDDAGYLITGRYDTDRFITLAEVGEGIPSGEERLHAFRGEFDENSPIPGATVKYSIYDNVEHSVPIRTLCHRAFAVVDSIKHRYGVDEAKYSPEFQKEIDLRDLIENDMMSALRKKQFKVYYQPKFSIRGDKDQIAGAEALVRWIHPVQGFMTPGVFIPQFEKNGFISKLDKYVLDCVCRDLKEWLENGDPVYPVSINLSRIDFSTPDFAECAAAVVDSYGIPHELIHFEVTETAFFARDDLLKKSVHALHEAGFALELDDFGAGYSTLSSLQSLDLDIIKMDMSLIREDDPESEKSILEFAHNLVRMMKLKTIQEGVETKEELERVRALGCDYVQGYYFSKPLEKTEYIAFCRRGQ